MKLELAEDERPIISFGKESFLADLLPKLYQFFHSRKDYYDICRQFAAGIKLSEREKNPVQLKRERLIYRVLNYINEHYKEPLTLKQISAVVYINEAYLSHMFKKETGLSPIRYMMQRRMGEAQSLLMETSIPIQDIEDLPGFNSDAHFSKMFKKYVGVTPNEYRKHFPPASDENKVISG